MQATTIDSSGDVWLVVGASLGAPQKLRVSAQSLTEYSDMFSAMFGGHWSEGRNRSAQQPVDVPLPVDPPHAMTLFAKIAHNIRPCNASRQVVVPGAITDKQLLDFVVLVDKMQVGDNEETVEYIQQWFDALVSDPLAQLETIILAMHIADSPENTLTACQAFLRYSAEAPRIGLLQTQDFAVPEDVKDELGSQWNKVRRDKDIAPSRILQGLAASWHTCRGQGMALFSQHLSQVGLWPDSQDSLTLVLDRAASIEYKPVLKECVKGDCACTRAKKDLLRGYQAIEDYIDSTCFHCIFPGPVCPSARPCTQLT